jgi:hypothetical protein
MTYAAATDLAEKVAEALSVYAIQGLLESIVIDALKEINYTQNVIPLEKVWISHQILF